MSNKIKRYRDRRLVDHGRVVGTDWQQSREEGLDLGGMLRALWEGKWFVIAAFVLSLGATALFLLAATPRYEATSLVSVDAGAAPLPGTESTLQRPSVEGEIGRLRSSGELARRVFQRLGPADSIAVVTNEEADASDSESAGNATVRGAFDLYERMAFNATSNGIIAITATSTEPAEAAQMANLYAEAYQELSQEERRSSLQAARAFLESQLTQRQDELRAIEQRWASYVGSQQSPGNGGEAAAQYASALGQLRTVKSQLQQERLQLQQIEDELSRLGAGLVGAITSDLQAQIDAIQERIASLKLEAEDYYAVNPDLRGREEDVPELNDILTTVERLENRRSDLAEQLAAQALTGNVTNAVSGVDYASRLRERADASSLRIRQLETEAAGLEGRVSALEAQLSGVPRQQVEVERINRERELTEEEYVAFVRQLQAIRVAEQAELGYVSIVREAFLPVQPVWPKPMGALFLSGLFGLFLGGGIALIHAAVRQRLRQPEDLAEHGFRLMGVVPPIEKEVEVLSSNSDPIVIDGRPRSPKLLPLFSPWSPASENYRLIRTNIQHGPVGKAPRSILITSPEMSDGKTLTAVNLAVTMAQGGQRTLLIGADLRRPTAHSYLGIDCSPGLAEVLEASRGDEPVSSERLGTGIERLYFLPAGRSEIPPPELLSSPRMRDVFSRFREEYDVVIVDAPPVLVATDALLLAKLCEATLVVVTADKTSPSVLEATQSMLEGVGAKITGTVLNRFAGRADGAGHYGYGYKHAYAEHE